MPAAANAGCARVVSLVNQGRDSSCLGAAVAVLGVLPVVLVVSRSRLAPNPIGVERLNSLSAQGLVDDLLDVARIEAGKLGLDLREVSPDLIVHNAVESYLPLATGASVQLEAEVSPGLPLGLADEERIQQVLGNLLNNAIKFTPRGGRVRIVAQQEGDEIRFAVMDTGPGISPDHLPRVFDRFWQSRSADRRSAGLGLAIAKGIVEAHGGHIWAESVPGEGSTFSFTLRAFCPQPDLKVEINTRMAASHSPSSCPAIG